MNPPSEYGTTPVKVTLYGQCRKDVPKQLLVTSFAELTAFSRGLIESYNAEFRTETEVIGTKDAILQVAFRPETIFKK